MSSDQKQQPPSKVTRTWTRQRPGRYSCALYGLTIVRVTDRGYFGNDDYWALLRDSENVLTEISRHPRLIDAKRWAELETREAAAKVRLSQAQKMGAEALHELNAIAAARKISGA